jgi:hypothetical protein
MFHAFHRTPMERINLYQPNSEGIRRATAQEQIDDDIEDAEVTGEIEIIPLEEELQEWNEYLQQWDPYESPFILPDEPGRLWYILNQALVYSDDPNVETQLRKFVTMAQGSGLLFRFNSDRTYDSLDLVLAMPSVLEDRLLQYVLDNNIHIQKPVPEYIGQAIRRNRRKDQEGMAQEDKEIFYDAVGSVFDTKGRGLHYKAKYIRPPMIYHHRTKPRLK